MIRRVKIEGYKSLRNIELRLRPLTVIFGPNAAGKSNLFDALALLSRMGTAKTLRDAFDPLEHRGTPLEAFTYGDRGLDGLLESNTASFTIEVDVELSREVVEAVETRIRQLREGIPERDAKKPRKRVTQRHLRYRIAVEIVPQTGILRVQDEELVALNADGTVNQHRTPFISLEKRRLRLRMEGQARPTEHELGLDYTLVSSQLYPPHYPHVTAFREELSRWHFYYLEPDLMRSEIGIQEAAIMDRRGAKLAAFYYTLKQRDERKFKGMLKALSLLVPAVSGLDVGPTSSGLLELVVQENGSRYSSRLASEGTLRVLGLLAITRPLGPVSVVGYEEPENGVHPRRLKLIADLLIQATSDSDIQFLVNTHSPILPDHLKTTATLVACRQGPQGSMFGEVGPLFADEISQRILQGDFGG
jgi:predicted ATPase